MGVIGLINSLAGVNTPVFAVQIILVHSCRRAVRVIVCDAGRAEYTQSHMLPITMPTS